MIIIKKSTSIDVLNQGRYLLDNFIPLYAHIELMNELYLRYPEAVYFIYTDIYK